MTEGFTVWLTGLSGSGKSTIAARLAAELRARGLAVVVLDGDEIRAGLSADLGFGRDDRDTQVRRVGWICELLARSGIVAIAALVSPYRAARAEVRARVGRFLEVFVEAPLATLAERDTKGLYGGAARGEVSDLTGVGDPYEPPEAPDVHCLSDGTETPEACAKRIIAALEAAGHLARPGFAADEEAAVHARLAELGYIE